MNKLPCVDSSHPRAQATFNRLNFSGLIVEDVICMLLSMLLSMVAFELVMRAYVLRTSQPLISRAAPCRCGMMEANHIAKQTVGPPAVVVVHAHSSLLPCSLPYRLRLKWSLTRLPHGHDIGAGCSNLVYDSISPVLRVSWPRAWRSVSKLVHAISAMPSFLPKPLKLAASSNCEPPIAQAASMKLTIYVIS